MTLYEKVKASIFSIIRLAVCDTYGVSIAAAVTKDTDEACEEQIHKIRGSYIFEIQKTDVQVNVTILLIDGTVKITRFTMFVRSVGGLFRECTSPFTDSVKDLVMKKLEELREVGDTVGDYCKADVDICKYWLTAMEMERRKAMKQNRFAIVRSNLFSVVKEAFLTVFGGQINKDSLDVKSNYFRYDEATSAFFDPVAINASWDYITENGDVVRTVSIKICVGDSDIDIKNLDITCRFPNIQNFRSEIPWKLYPEYSIKMKREILSRLSELLEDEVHKEMVLIAPRGNCKAAFKRMFNSMYGMASLSLPEFKYCINDLSILGKIPGADLDGYVISKEEIQNIIKGEDTMNFDCMKIIEETKKIINNFFNFNRYTLKTLSPDFAAEILTVATEKARAYHYLDTDANLHKIQIAANYATNKDGCVNARGVLSVELAYDDDFHLDTTVEAGITIPANVLKKFRETLECDLCKLKSYGKFTVDEPKQPRYPWGKPNEDGLAQALEKIHLLSNANARLIEAYSRKDSSLKVDHVISNYPAVVVFWKDGSKTIVKCGPDDQFDIEKGVAMAFAKKALGNDYAAGGRFKAILKHVQIETKKEPKKKEEKEEEPVIVEAPKNAKPKKADFVKAMISQGFTKAEAERAWKGMNSKAK